MLDSCCHAHHCCQQLGARTRARCQAVCLPAGRCNGGRVWRADADRPRHRALHDMSRQWNCGRMHCVMPCLLCMRHACPAGACVSPRRILVLGDEAAWLRSTPRRLSDDGRQHVSSSVVLYKRAAHAQLRLHGSHASLACVSCALLSSGRCQASACTVADRELGWLSCLLAVLFREALCSVQLMCS